MDKDDPDKLKPPFQRKTLSAAEELARLKRVGGGITRTGSDYAIASRQSPALSRKSTVKEKTQSALKATAAVAMAALRFDTVSSEMRGSIKDYYKVLEKQQGILSFAFYCQHPNFEKRATKKLLTSSDIDLPKQQDSANSVFEAIQWAPRIIEDHRKAVATLWLVKEDTSNELEKVIVTFSDSDDVMTLWMNRKLTRKWEPYSERQCSSVRLHRKQYDVAKRQSGLVKQPEQKPVREKEEGTDL